MWRTVIVNRGEKITVRDGHLTVFCDDLEQKIPLDDIYAVVLDNDSASVSVAALTALARAGAHVCYCDAKHLPVAVSYPLNTYYRPAAILQRQMAMTAEFKEVLWQRVAGQKLRNQAACLRFCGVPEKNAAVLDALADAVLPGDVTNREAVGAKKYFAALFGAPFKRSDEGDVTNAALNYGYAILRSSLGKSLAVHGYNGALGVHHCGSANPFNLADDLMEPLRPLVDLWTDRHCDELLETLTRTNRRDLIGLVNLPMRMDGKKMRTRYVIDQYVRSLTTAILENDPGRLMLPELIPLDEFFEDDLDG